MGLYALGHKTQNTNT